MKDIEQRVYELMCHGCEKEHLCHEKCETCEEFNKQVEIFEKAPKKYIRTNENIWEVEQDPNDKDHVIFQGRGKFGIIHIDNVHLFGKLGDTIEELCDECISVLENGKGSHILHESDLDEKIPCLFHNARMFQEDDEIIYGAIWTDKGLIYVARMDEKGELELL